MILNRYVLFVFAGFFLFSGCSDWGNEQAERYAAVEKAFRQDKQVVVPEGKEIISLLSNGKYQEVEGLLRAVQEEYERGGNEYAVFKAYKVFEMNDRDLLQSIDKWIKFSPDSYVAYAARGIYRVSQGWRRRGHGFINKTSDEQIDGMRESNYKAAIDLDKALKLNPRFLPAYEALLQIGMNTFGHEFLDKVFAEAMQQNPASYYIYRSYIYANEPKWGGSFEMLEEIADRAQKYIDKNPRLYTLISQKYIVKGNSRFYAEKYNAAIKYFSEALKFGPGEYSLYKRARAYGKINNIPKKLADLNLLLDIHPDYVDALEERGDVYKEQRRFDKAIVDYEKAIRIKPDKKWVTNSLGWIYQTQGNYNKSALMFEQTLRYRPDDKYALLQLGWTYNKLTLYNKAIPLLKRRLELTPDNARAWLYLGDAQIDTNNPDGRQSLLQYLELVDVNDKNEQATIKKVKHYLATGIITDG